MADRPAKFPEEIYGSPFSLTANGSLRKMSKLLEQFLSEWDRTIPPSFESFAARATSSQEYWELALADLEKRLTHDIEGSNSAYRSTATRYEFAWPPPIEFVLGEFVRNYSSTAGRQQLYQAVFPSYSGEIAKRNDLVDRSGQEEDEFATFADADSPDDAPQSTSLPAQGGNVRYFGEYHLVNEIARGGMGVVYRAEQLSLERTVALKMMLSGDAAGAGEIERFKNEARAAAKLDHPGIVGIYEVGMHDDRAYFTMELVDGPDLATWVSKKHLRPGQIAEIMIEVSEAIEHAHNAGILHRDIKPSNILVDPQGAFKVTDFGLAKSLRSNSELTQTGQLLGTPGYLPPEQVTDAKGMVSPSSDVYSLGALLYFLLTGKPPFSGENLAEVLKSVLDVEPSRPSRMTTGVPKDLETICLKCLEKRSKDRYPSAQELSDDLNRFVNHQPVIARPVSIFGRGMRFFRRNRTISYICAAATILFVAAGLAVSSRLRNDALVRSELEDKKVRVEYGARLQRAFQESQRMEFSDAGKTLAGLPVELRGFEWDFVDRMSKQGLLTLATPGIRCAGSLNQGKELIWGDESGTLWKIDLPNDAVAAQRKFGRSPILDLAISPDNSLVAVSLDRWTFQILDTQNLATVVERKILRADPSGGQGLRFSPDGNYLACAGSGMIWSTDDWSKIPIQQGEEAVRGDIVSNKFAQCNSATWSPDSRYFGFLSKGRPAFFDVLTREVSFPIEEENVSSSGLDLFALIEDPDFVPGSFGVVLSTEQSIRIYTLAPGIDDQHPSGRLHAELSDGFVPDDPQDFDFDLPLEEPSFAPDLEADIQQIVSMQIGMVPLFVVHRSSGNVQVLVQHLGNDAIEIPTIGRTNKIINVPMQSGELIGVVKQDSVEFHGLTRNHTQPTFVLPGIARPESEGFLKYESAADWESTEPTPETASSLSFAEEFLRMQPIAIAHNWTDGVISHGGAFVCTTRDSSTSFGPLGLLGTTSSSIRLDSLETERRYPLVKRAKSPNIFFSDNDEYLFVHESSHSSSPERSYSDLRKPFQSFKAFSTTAGESLYTNTSTCQCTPIVTDAGVVAVALKGGFVLHDLDQKSDIASISLGDEEAIASWQWLGENSDRLVVLVVDAQGSFSLREYSVSLATQISDWSLGEILVGKKNTPHELVVFRDQVYLTLQNSIGESYETLILDVKNRTISGSFRGAISHQFASTETDRMVSYGPGSIFLHTFAEGIELLRVDLPVKDGLFSHALPFDIRSANFFANGTRILVRNDLLCWVMIGSTDSARNYYQDAAEAESRFADTMW